MVQKIGEKSIQSRGLLVHEIDRRAYPAKTYDVKTYVFAPNFDRVYGAPVEALQEVSDCLKANPSALLFPKEGRKIFYGIAFPWGYEEHGGVIRRVDFVLPGYDAPFSECNPEVKIHVFQDRKFIDDPELCETGSIITGREGELRRTIAASDGHLDRYIHEFVDLGHMGPVDPKFGFLHVYIK